MVLHILVHWRQIAHVFCHCQHFYRNCTEALKWPEQKQNKKKVFFSCQPFTRNLWRHKNTNKWHLNSYLLNFLRGMYRGPEMTWAKINMFCISGAKHLKCTINVWKSWLLIICCNHLFMKIGTLISFWVVIIYAFARVRREDWYQYCILSDMRL